MDRPLDQHNFASHYDRWILSNRARELHGDDGFYNVGDWSGVANPEQIDLQTAARRLVRRHCAIDLESDRARTVLDVGCGLGASTATFADRYRHALMVGVNISVGQLAVAAHKAPTALLAAADGAALPFASDSFDRIHCVEAALHFDTRQAFIEEAYRILRSGGLCVLTDFLVKRPLGALAIPAANICATLEEYGQRCRMAGFAVEFSEEVGAVTLWPFCEHLERHGERAMALALRRCAAGYLVAALRKP